MTCQCGKPYLSRRASACAECRDKARSASVKARKHSPEGRAKQNAQAQARRQARRLQRQKRKATWADILAAVAERKAAA